MTDKERCNATTTAESASCYTVDFVSYFYGLILQISYKNYQETKKEQPTLADKPIPVVGNWTSSLD